MSKILDKGFVRLDASMASDLSVVNSARVSFAKQSEYEWYCEECEDCEAGTCGADAHSWEQRLKSEDAGLIRYLLRNRHGTPFEHSVFRFHVKCPIFVAREWMRHRIGSFNEWSGRYSKLEPEFYIPENIRSQVGKPGAYTFEEMSDDDKIYVRAHIGEVVKGTWDTYEHLLERGVAKEVARMVLPVNIYTQFYWTINARSLMNFLSLRNSEHAMYEIRQYAIVIEEIFAAAMPVTHEAFIANDRVAP